MRILLSLFSGILIAFLLANCGAEKSNPNPVVLPEHDLAGELRSMYDLNLLPAYLDNSFVAQISSYDTTGGNDDGFSGKYSFLEKNPNGSLIIFKVKGKGVINRIWTPTPTADTLDFYFKESLVPDFSIRFIDLFTGKQFPFVSPLCGNQVGGYYCYLPIPFEDGCTIVTRGKTIQFHQIQYRLYKDDQPVKNFSITLNEDEKNSLKQVADFFNKPEKKFSDLFQFGNPSINEETKSIDLKPNSTITLWQSSAGGRILGIELSPAEVFEGLYKNVDLKITWDDEATPAVFCPVADFFGYAFGNTSMESLVIGTFQNRCYAYFPMPFDKRAKIELINRSESTISLASKIYSSSQKRNSNAEGKFYAVWNSSMPANGKPHFFAEIKGKGHYVGTILQSQGLKAGMTYFFEGDDSTVIDGTMRMHGTGSEDYFNGGWYALMDRWEGKYSMPLHGALDYSVAFCRTGGYRLFIPDKMSFQNSFHHSIEHGPTKNSFPVIYTSLGFYYGDRAPEQIQTPVTENTKVFISDTLYLYPQLLDFTLRGKINLETTWKYGTGGESFHFTVDDGSQIRVSLNGIPDGQYSVGVDLIGESTGCEFSIWQRQTQVSEWMSANQTEETRKTFDAVPELYVNTFKRTLTFHFKTSPGKNTFLLNRVVLIKKPQM